MWSGIPLPANGERLGMGFRGLPTSPPSPSPLAERGRSLAFATLCAFASSREICRAKEAVHAKAQSRKETQSKTFLLKESSALVRPANLIPLAQNAHVMSRVTHHDVSQRAHRHSRAICHAHPRQDR